MKQLSQTTIAISNKNTFSDFFPSQNDLFANPASLICFMTIFVCKALHVASDSSIRFLTFGIFDTQWTVIFYCMLACDLYLGSTWAKTTYGGMFYNRYCSLIVVVVVAGAASSSSSSSSSLSSLSSSHLYRHLYLYLCFHRLRHRHRLVIVIVIIVVIVIMNIIIVVVTVTVIVTIIIVVSVTWSPSWTSSTPSLKLFLNCLMRNRES